MLRKKGSHTTYTEPTPCATCKHASRQELNEKHLAPFMALCGNEERNKQFDYVQWSGTGNLVYTHIRPDMRVPEQQCNEYEAKQ